MDLSFKRKSNINTAADWLATCAVYSTSFEPDKIQFLIPAIITQ